MASHKLSLFLCSLVNGLLLFSPLVHCEETGDNLFKALNNYRSSLKLPTLTKNSHEDCLATEIAWEFDDQSPFSISASGSTIAPGNLTQLPNFPDYLSRCKINLNHTKKGVILPLHIPRLALNLALTNCTHSQVAKYLSKPEYTSVGIGYYEDWVVFALGTTSPAGTFSSSTTLSALGHRHVFLVSSFLLGMLLICG